MYAIREYIAGARRMEDAQPPLTKTEPTRPVAIALKRAMTFVVAAMSDNEVIYRVASKQAEMNLLLNFINSYMHLLRGECSLRSVGAHD
jgi:hypothetical protein